MVGFSGGLSAELKRRGIYVTTVIPGLMRTGSFVNAYFKGEDSEYTWFSLGATMPLASMDAERAAQRMIRACEYGESVVTVGAPAKLARLGFNLLPGIGTELAALANRFALPRASEPQRYPGRADEPGEKATSGRQVRDRRKPGVWRPAKGPLESQSDRYNEGE
jgi:NAD(P)-dependent dehydrogenase (short-subunit alcohol dehydrogenase family)